MSLKLVYTTLPTPAAAEELATSLVRARLAACGNILPAHTAIFEWEGQIERSQEVILLLKTTAEQVDAVVAQVRAGHPYAVPAILVLPVEAAEPAFAAWVATQTGSAAKV